MRNISNKIFHNVFWTCVIILLCLLVGILVSPWYNYEYANYPDKKVIEKTDEKIKSLPWSFKVLYAPIVEELVFRGPIFIFLLLSAKYKKAKGNRYILVILLGILFGIAHVQNGGIYTFPSVIFQLISVGCFLGFLVVKTKGLVCSIGAHSVLNLMAMV